MKKQIGACCNKARNQESNKCSLVTDESLSNGYTNLYPMVQQNTIIIVQLREIYGCVRPPFLEVITHYHICDENYDMWSGCYHARTRLAEVYGIILITNTHSPVPSYIETTPDLFYLFYLEEIKEAQITCESEEEFELCIQYNTWLQQQGREHEAVTPKIPLEPMVWDPMFNHNILWPDSEVGTTSGSNSGAFNQASGSNGGNVYTLVCNIRNEETHIL
ncbi:hypothetical protein ACOSQ2_004726 [Xanthoceras sorbifolium]